LQDKNILHTVKNRKVNWIGHILRRNCLQKHVTEDRRTQVTGRRGRRRKRLLDDLKNTRRCWKFKEKALDRTIWRTRCRRGYGPVVRHNYSMNKGSRCKSSDSKQANPERKSEVWPIQSSWIFWRTKWQN